MLRHSKVGPSIGGACGVDEASMRGAIEANGTVIGVVADSLLKTATSHKYRDAIQRSDITPCPTIPRAASADRTPWRATSMCIA